jgi:hypothetical protein
MLIDEVLVAKIASGRHTCSARLKECMLDIESLGNSLDNDVARRHSCHIG